MNVWKRLGYFFIGVSIGSFVVYLFFGARTDIQCNYFPEDRVLYDLRLKRWEMLDGSPLDSTLVEALKYTSDVVWDSCTMATRTENPLDSTNHYLLQVSYKGEIHAVRVQGFRYRAEISSIRRGEGQ